MPRTIPSDYELPSSPPPTSTGVFGVYCILANTVIDDFSRFILAHKLQRDMTSDSFIEVVQDAVDMTGMTEVPVADRTRLLSDNGSGYVSRSIPLLLIDNT